MIEVQMKQTWFALTRGQCSTTRRSFRVHGENGAQFQRDNLNYWVLMLLLHS